MKSSPAGSILLSLCLGYSDEERRGNWGQAVWPIWSSRRQGLFLLGVRACSCIGVFDIGNLESVESPQVEPCLA